ncbi:MAG: IMP dehydrogenase [Deinococcota bacterium]
MSTIQTPLAPVELGLISKQLNQESLVQEALLRTRERLRQVQFDSNQTYYTFADKTIVPTFLTSLTSRSQVKTEVSYAGLHGAFTCFPALGASMSYMRSRFARDIAEAGGVHVLPRVGLDPNSRLADVTDCNSASVGVSIGLKDSHQFLAQLVAKSNVQLLSIDIAHGANAAVLPLLMRIRELGIDQGVMLGNVGSVEGFVFAYHLMQLAGFRKIMLKVGVGPGSVCTTRLNTGVGVGQFTLLEELACVKDDLLADDPTLDITIISDGGINTSGDFAKAVALSDGVMMGKFFASGSLEEGVLVHDEHGNLVGVTIFGMASAYVPDKSRYVEGGIQTVQDVHDNAQAAVARLRDGLRSAMTYVDAHDIATFKQNVRFATNSAGTRVENGIH